MENGNLKAVASATPVAAYVGGKRQLAKRLIERIEATPHQLYAEPFVGMGGVFLRRDKAPKVEVINDVSRDVATLFRVLQRHDQALRDMLRWQLTSRGDFERLVATEPETLTDLERAARFLYVQRLAFGGKVAGRTFGIDRRASAPFDTTRLWPLLDAVHERLAGVWIECLPWRAFLARWDRPGALFFCDPPYWGTEDYYGKGLFGRDEFALLAATLKTLQGGFILTVNDHPETRAIFGDFTIETAAVTYTVDGTAPKRASELIVSGP